MNNDPIRFGTYFKAWICFYLLSLILSALIGALLGGLMGGILGVMGYDIDFIQRAARLLGGIASIPISLFTFIWISKKYVVARLLPPALPTHRPETYADNPN